METKEQTLVAELRGKVEVLEKTVASLQESLTRVRRRAVEAEYQCEELELQIIRLQIDAKY